ncbi:MAG: hypothetical protein F4X24_06625 [Rhodobacteraceae bacterium]|nr:hypothetical protein [Paracoccaceae bacterium]
MMIAPVIVGAKASPITNLRRTFSTNPVSVSRGIQIKTIRIEKAKKKRANQRSDDDPDFMCWPFS